ncbi:trypsin-like peptidase domain-containing protein [uncultured Brevundimonas sp.]|uniref:trypsin-like peptidase domain-containing protein n=1 Tax=uncultured Brevundimonas sp. TaxID=213418 RepID=UPI0030EB7347|tara:strand:+ start:21885 stop:23297 length:1413 start_codon:yes stop_codon:yes gene_type:complete
MMRRANFRNENLSTVSLGAIRIGALASVLAVAMVAPVAAQTPYPGGTRTAPAPAVRHIPFDTRRGVFSFASGLEQSLPAVVQVTTLGSSRGPSSGENEARPVATGSGVIIDAAAGIIVTNNHVVENGRKFTVDMVDGRLVDAVLIGVDKATDLAVLKIDTTGLTQVSVADSDTLRAGDLAFAVGYPLGLDQTLTMGVVSGLNRSGLGDAVEDYIQTDAAVNSGNSGGPLLDSLGRLIGINTSILSGGGGGNDGIAFAVPSRIMLHVVGQLREFGEVQRGSTGAIFGSLNAERAHALGVSIVRGAVVDDVAPGSPAEAAGLQRNDIITRIQSRPVANAGSVRATIGIAAPGAGLTVTYLRGGRERTTSLSVERPVEARVILGTGEVQAFGAAFRDLRAGDGVSQSGVLVTAVEGGSIAAARRLIAGDVVSAVDGTRVADIRTLSDALNAAGETVELTVSRAGAAQTVVLGD